MNSSPQAASDEGCRSRPCGGIPARMSDRVLIKMRAGKGDQEDKEHVYRYVPARRGSIARERQIIEPGRDVPVHESVREPVEQQRDRSRRDQKAEYLRKQSHIAITSFAVIDFWINAIWRSVSDTVSSSSTPAKTTGPHITS